MTTLKALEQEESEIHLPAFNSDVAWELGNICRKLALEYEKPVVISISLANSSQLLFHSCSRPGTTPDNAFWVRRKQATVLRWGRSSLHMKIRMDTNPKPFPEQFSVKPEDYAPNGGGVPIRVKGLEGLAGVIVISGLTQEEDHELAVKGIRQYLKTKE